MDDISCKLVRIDSGRTTHKYIISKNKCSAEVLTWGCDDNFLDQASTLLTIVLQIIPAKHVKKILNIIMFKGVPACDFGTGSISLRNGFLEFRVPGHKTSQLSSSFGEHNIISIELANPTSIKDAAAYYAVFTKRIRNVRKQNKARATSQNRKKALRARNGK